MGTRTPPLRLRCFLSALVHVLVVISICPSCASRLSLLASDTPQHPSAAQSPSAEPGTERIHGASKHSVGAARPLAARSPAPVPPQAPSASQGVAKPAALAAQDPARPLVAVKPQNPSPAQGAGSHGSGAAPYLDDLLASDDTARAKLTGKFTKRSKTAVVYMCYERTNIVRHALAALVKSEGLQEMDVIISQDGGSNYVLELPPAPGVNMLYIEHPVNLCPGQHHFLIKHLVFDVMGYESLIVVEEDSIVHPQAIQVLSGLLAVSANDTEVGLVSVCDVDNSLVLNATRYSAAALRVGVHLGHLWVFGLHSSRYQAVQDDLREYFNTVKGRDYTTKDVPPLVDQVVALERTKGFPAGIPHSQDSFFVHSLGRAGFRKRLTTMVRLFEPVGWQGLHFQQSIAQFYNYFGPGMYMGRVVGEPREAGRSAEDVQEITRECLAGLDRIYQQHLLRDADERAKKDTVARLFSGELNVIDLVYHMVNSAEHKRVHGRDGGQAAVVANPVHRRWYE